MTNVKDVKHAPPAGRRLAKAACLLLGLDPRRNKDERVARLRGRPKIRQAWGFDEADPFGGELASLLDDGDHGAEVEIERERERDMHTYLFFASPSLVYIQIDMGG